MRRKIGTMSQGLLLAATTLAAGAAAASGPSGTDGLSELTLTGSQWRMLLGGAAFLGFALWVVVRVLSK